jgi:hypothetical protein
VAATYGRPALPLKPAAEGCVNKQLERGATHLRRPASQPPAPWACHHQELESAARGGGSSRLLIIKRGTTTSERVLGLERWCLQQGLLGATRMYRTSTVRHGLSLE